MGFNNSINRGSKFIANINSRFSELVVAAQLKGLLKDEHVPYVAQFTQTVKTDFEAIPGKADVKPRYKDDVPAHMFWDEKPKRILLSKYKEYLGCDMYPIGMNYGVLIGKSITISLGGHEFVSRVIALRGLIGVYEAVMALEDGARSFMGNEIALLGEAIALETREAPRPKVSR